MRHGADLHWRPRRTRATRRALPLASAMLPLNPGSAGLDCARRSGSPRAGSRHPNRRRLVLPVHTFAAGANENLFASKPHLEHRQRAAGGDLPYFAGAAVVTRTVPGALQRSVMEQVTKRHRKMLMGANIAERGDLVLKANETYRVTTRAHALQQCPLRQIAQRGDRFELGIRVHRP